METRCVFCTEHPSLEKPTLITDHARIVGLGGIVDNVSTFFRTCPQCHMVYRYQEWQAGLHNFNDHTVRTLELCIFLRHNLQNHVSVSRAINSLEGLREVKYPSRDTVLHAYCQFEAMTSHDYVYSCINCGYYPPVVMMDLHKKGVFSMAVSDIKDPPEQFKGEHNIEEFWDSVNLEMIARGFVQSRAKNPLAVYPSFDRWAPWIGGHTRKSDIVLNTEYQKLSSAKATAESELVMVTEERLVDELRKQKVGIVRKLCKACNIDSKGSRDDLILRLRNEMKNRHSYDKVFQKIWGASGGWAVIACPHGIVYSLKFNLRAESPRDFADLLMSWKHLPNVSVYDFARGLTTHTNLWFPDVMPFQPNEGRLAECTPDNITAAQKGKLEVSLSWLLEKKVNPDPESHPTTGSSCHFALHDKFHESNTKDQRDVLRRINHVPELQGWLNSQVVEQLFGVMKKNNYFLNNMAPSTHVFMMRNIIHHRNIGTNQQLLDQQLHKGLKFHHMHTIALNEVGQAVLSEYKKYLFIIHWMK
ncbi:hypothetical protein AMEX_G18045 [Astyanax mexicanus]|uniref:HMG domain-containing protein n=1 Tax=Astyanax mexicanus TaxID=7994 RepID=A0A8T2LD58_ASTMX|nr:hypothetical protein AMEX_G18045 [Astyanax mexicanus]